MNNNILVVTSLNMGGNGVKLMIFELKGVYVMTHEYRVEQDLIGMKNVPEHAYYGIQTVRAEENFNITGYMISHEIITALAIVKKVTTITNMELGHLDQTIGEPIRKAADEIIRGKWHDEFIVDPIQGGAGTSINMNANEVIANRALELIEKKKVNMILFIQIYMLI